MILCPQCPQFYDRNDIALVDVGGNHLEGRRWGLLREDAVSRLPGFIRSRIANVRIREARARLEGVASWKCPHGHHLPDDFVTTPTVVIGLLGPPFTMKTTYLGQLISALVERDALGRLGLTFAFADNASRAEYTVKMAARLERRRAPLATPLLAHDGEVTAPIVLRMSGQRGIDAQRKKVNLLFFDVAGEGTLDPQTMAQDNTFLHVMNAAMLFVTPRALLLPAEAPEPVGDEGLGPRQTITVFDHLAQALQQHPRYTGKYPPRDLPIALILAKADQLRPLMNSEFPGLPLDETFLVDTDDKLDAVGEVPYDELMRLGGQSLVTRLFQLTEARSIHAVSAMGGDPEPAEMGSVGDPVFVEVRPWHVVDPLLALLYQLNLIGRSDAGA